MMDIFAMELETAISLGLTITSRIKKGIMQFNTKDASLFARRQKVVEGNPLGRGGCHKLLELKEK